MKKLLLLGTIFGIIPTLLGVIMSKSLIITILVGLFTLRAIAKEICE